jgi:hypothetical protein
LPESANKAFHPGSFLDYLCDMRRNFRQETGQSWRMDER